MDLVKRVIKFVIVALLAFAVWQFGISRLWAVKPLYPYSYIVVYGSNACSLCEDFMKALTEMGTPYLFKDIKASENDNAEIISRMKKAGLDTSRFTMPVVDVNGKIMLEPDAKKVTELYKRGQWNPLKPVTDKLLKPAAPRATPLDVTGIITGNPSEAIVGNKIVRVGDKIGTNEIIEISGDSVKFKDATGNILIKKVK